MKKKYIFIFVLILTSILIFGVAYSCNLCSVPVEIGETTEITGNKKEESTEGSTETTQDINDKEQQAQATVEETGETSGDTQQTSEETQDTEETQNGNNPPELLEIDGISIEEIEAWEGPLWISPISIENSEHSFPIIIKATDEDGDELTYKAYDDRGNSFEVIKTDNNNAYCNWIAPYEAGPYNLTIEVSDGKGGKDLCSFDATLSPRENQPPVISGINLLEISTGRVIEIGEVTQGIKGGYEYRIEIDAWDFDRDLINDYGLETTGLIREDPNADDIWTALIWTPPEPGDEIILKEAMTFTIHDEAGHETKKSTEVWITN